MFKIKQICKLYRRNARLYGSYSEITYGRHLKPG